MTIRYVGVGGSNSNDGLSWATRKLTLNGVEDSPVAAGDTVYVGAGTYRESLTVDVSGGSGSPITYIGDEDGSHTDGVGGAIRVTGSNDDTTVTRASCITDTSHNYRTFRGFHFDSTSSVAVNLQNPQNWIIEQCAFHAVVGGVQIQGASQLTCTVRRCLFIALSGNGVIFSHSANLSDIGHVVENCILIGMPGATAALISFSMIGGGTVRNNSLCGAPIGIRVPVTLTSGQVITANNNIITACVTGMSAATLGNLVEDYNNVSLCSTARANVNTGANSQAYPILLAMPLLTMGIHVPIPFALDPASALQAIAGTGVATLDLYGDTRSSPSAWGAVEQDGDAYLTEGAAPTGGLLVHGGMAGGMRG